MARNTRRNPCKDPNEEVSALAIDLDLTALAEELPELLSVAERNSPSYTEFALSIFRHELNVRKDRRLTRALKRSHLGAVEGLEDFDFSVRPKLEPRIVKELCTCRFVEERRNVLLLGRPGLGKTRIAKAIAHAGCLAGYSVLCVLTAEMLERLSASTVDGTLRRVMRRYVKPDILLCDEFGYEPFDSTATKFLFRLISARHGHGSTILTANTGFARWKSLFPSEAAAVSTVDRLVGGATILRFTGKSYRTPKEIVGAPLEE